MAKAGERRFAAAAGRRFLGAALAAAGLAAEDAAQVARLMLLADLRGIDSHGIMRLPGYVARLRAGGINPRPRIRVAAEAPAIALVDGDNGMGHLVMRFAAAQAIAKARETGVAWVGTRRSNHAGAGACYAMMPLAAGMVGLYLAVANKNRMPPAGGVEALVGTNPIAIAIPAGEEPPVVLDIATTAISSGKIKVAASLGESLPEGLVMDHEGRPITDPNREDEGLLLPVGGYKGFGLSLVFSLLGGALNGMSTGRDAASLDEASDAGNTGQAILALDVARFGPLADFTRRVDKVARDIRTSKPMAGVGEVRYPGLNGHRTAREREAAGIPIHAALLHALGRLAAALGIAPIELIEDGR